MIKKFADWLVHKAYLPTVLVPQVRLIPARWVLAVHEWAGAPCLSEFKARG